MKPIAELSSDQLIAEHSERWKAWIDRRRMFGEMGATGDQRMADLEFEAMRRGIEDGMMAPVKDYVSDVEQLLP